ncbi:MAG: radical SAM family heme chaperone HemW [Planctomycetota bacterium]
MNANEPPWIWPRAAYVHLPFCAHHCGYCDFAVAVHRDDRRAAYLDALSRELERAGTPQKVDTLFFGGGTPTFFTAQELERCLHALRTWFPQTAGQEFSVEANPGTFDAEKLGVLRDAGLTRVSLGCQSFDPDVLRTLERDHAPADAHRAVELLRGRDIAMSLDLIFGVPGQTLEQWSRDLDIALALEPDGVATYGLTFEKGTRLWKQRRDGVVHGLNEDLELAMYEHAIDRLEGAGYVHVELSNFARPGKECRHNHVYWANEAHWGFGMGAAEYVRGRRCVNTRDLDTYIRRALAGTATAQQSETLEPRERALETLGQNLRRRLGIERERFAIQTGFSLAELGGAALERLVAWGLLQDDGRCVFLTRRGKCVADSVTAEFWKSSFREGVL